MMASLVNEKRRRRQGRGGQKEEQTHPSYMQIICYTEDVELKLNGSVGLLNSSLIKEE